MTIASISITMTDEKRKKYQKEFDEIDDKCSALQKLDKGISCSMSFNVPVSTTDDLQMLSNEFNKDYLLATKTSDSDKYFRAALMGRQIINELCKRNLIQDTLGIK